MRRLAMVGMGLEIMAGLVGLEFVGGWERLGVVAGTLAVYFPTMMWGMEGGRDR